MEQIVWLLVLAVFLIIEFFTLGLTTIWFAGGALAAFVSTYAGAGIWEQIILFVLISVLLLYFTRPAAVKYFNAKRIKTNYEELIGKSVLADEEIDNDKGTGSVFLNGTTWTVRSSEDETRISKGERVRIIRLEGVKLIVEKWKGEL